MDQQVVSASSAAKAKHSELINRLAAVTIEWQDADAARRTLSARLTAARANHEAERDSERAAHDREVTTLTNDNHFLRGDIARIRAERDRMRNERDKARKELQLLEARMGQLQRTLDAALAYKPVKPDN